MKKTKQNTHSKKQDPKLQRSSDPLAFDKNHVLEHILFKVLCHIYPDSDDKIKKFMESGFTLAAAWGVPRSTAEYKMGITLVCYSQAYEDSELKEICKSAYDSYRQYLNYHRSVLRLEELVTPIISNSIFYTHACNRTDQ